MTTPRLTARATKLIQQDIPLEMQYRPTVAYEASELAPNTVYIDANGRLGTGNLPEHIQKMTDPRMLQSFNPDTNAQAAAAVQAALALDGVTRPTVIAKIDGRVQKVVFSDHQRTPAFKGTRTLEQVRAARSRTLPPAIAKMADLNAAFETGRAGMTEATARGLRGKFYNRPEVVQGMAAVARAHKAARAIDPVTGIKMQALAQMPPKLRERLLDAKTKHHGARAPLLFHPKKTGYKTPNQAGYNGPTKAGLLPDVSMGAIGSMVPGTAPETVFHSEPAMVRNLPLASAKGRGTAVLNRMLKQNAAAASSMADSLAQSSGVGTPGTPRDQQAAEQTEKALSQATQDQVVSSDGTKSYTIAEGAGHYAPAEVADGAKCGWKCWLLAILTAGLAGGGAYSLLKK